MQKLYVCSLLGWLCRGGNTYYKSSFYPAKRFHFRWFSCTMDDAQDNNFCLGDLINDAP